MDISERVAVVGRIFDEFNDTGTVNYMYECLAEDLTIRCTIEPGTPLSGPFNGKDGFKQYFAAFDEAIETPDHVVTDIIEGENKVVALGHETLYVKSTGERRTDSDWATIFTFRADEIVDILVIENTAVIANAYSPGR